MLDGDRLRMIAHNAVRKLPRPEACSRCLRVGKVEGHHEDYAKPTEVVWLCNPCHNARHKEIEEAKGRKWGQHNGNMRARWQWLSSHES